MNVDELNIKVSVLLIAYNHIDSIRKAIESVLCQKVNFNYEIIIHDDASTDGTSDIIREYASRYNNIIPVIEEENTYSKGSFNIYAVTLKKYINGRYVIILEGDDYWCDEYKMQKQADFLDTNLDYVAHTHCVKHILPSGKEYLSPQRDEGEWMPRDIIDWKDIYQTSSLMYRSELSVYGLDELGNWRAGDYILACEIIFQGRVAYSKDVMSVHILYGKGSYTKTNFNSDGGYRTSYDRLKKLQERGTVINKLDERTAYRYHNDFVYSQERRLADYYQEIGNYRGIIKNCKEYVRGKKIKSRLWLYASAYMPKLVCVYEKIRKLFAYN